MTMFSSLCGSPVTCTNHWSVEFRDLPTSGGHGSCRLLFCLRVSRAQPGHLCFLQHPENTNNQSVTSWTLQVQEGLLYLKRIQKGKEVIPHFSVSTFALLRDNPEVFLPKYSQTAILHAAHFWRVVNPPSTTGQYVSPMGLGEYVSLGEYCGPHTASSVFLILVLSPSTTHLSEVLLFD